MGHRRAWEALLKILPPDQFGDKAIARIRPTRLDGARVPNTDSGC